MRRIHDQFDPWFDFTHRHWDGELVPCQDTWFLEKACNVVSPFFISQSPSSLPCLLYLAVDPVRYHDLGVFFDFLLVGRLPATIGYGLLRRADLGFRSIVESLCTEIWVEIVVAET